MASGDAGGFSSTAQKQIKTYEDYLDTQVTEEDLYYLEDQDLAREVLHFNFY